MLSYDRYLTPASLPEAFALLAELPGARLVAGATDLLPWARDGRAGDAHLPALVDISRLPELQGIGLHDTPQGPRLRLGAATPIGAFQHDALLRQQAPVLARCAVWFADEQIREQATVGGNLVNASPAGDTQPALLAMNTHVTLARWDPGAGTGAGAGVGAGVGAGMGAGIGAVRERSLPLSEFITGPGRTLLQPGEIMTRLEMDAVPEHSGVFEKVGHRRSLVISTVCLAVLVRLDTSRQRIADLRIAIGAVGPVPERLPDVEDQLTGQQPTPELLRSASDSVADRVRSRSRQDYRREVLANFVERGIADALARAGLAVDRLPKEASHV